MSHKFPLFVLFAATLVGVAWLPLARSLSPDQPAVPPQPGHTLPHGGHGKPQQVAPQIEVVFVLDTTGSMSGMLQAAKDKIWSIASTMAAGQPAPQIRMGLVAYRDRGDAYVTRVTDLSTDLDSIHATLLELEAGGGGDGPESVNQALFEAVHHMSWSDSPAVYRSVFLVGDAPAHMDYPNDVPYPQTLAAAAARAIVVNSVQCGNLPDTRSDWLAIAQHGGGRFFEVDANGSAVAVSTPFDARIAELSAALDDTRLGYGDDAQKARQVAKANATARLHANASTQAQARRGAFNVSGSGARNLLGETDLVADVASGKVELETIERKLLPSALAVAPLAEIRATISAVQEKRDELTSQIKVLAEQRASFISEELADVADADSSLDEQILTTVRAQAAPAGLRYDDAKASY